MRVTGCVRKVVVAHHRVDRGSVNVASLDTTVDKALPVIALHVEVYPVVFDVAVRLPLRAAFRCKVFEPVAFALGARTHPDDEIGRKTAAQIEMLDNT